MGDSIEDDVKGDGLQLSTLVEEVYTLDKKD